jgi:phosphoribosylaminoimidazole-succinocarboxamide synthase
MGSVKDLTILEQAFENKAGRGNFGFSDRYSIFDWGEMPDHIKNKGRALAVMAAYNFEELEKRGIKTHYRGLVTADDKLIRFSDLKEGSNGSNIMQVDMAVVYKPTARKFIGEDGNPRIEYDYSFFDTNRGKINNYLVGLEIIFRNGLPKGSSIFKKIDRIKKEEDPAEREKKLSEIYRKLGLTSEPKPGDMLSKPVMNYTTKLEEGDRRLTEDEAYRASGLTEEEFAKVSPLTLKVNDFITEQAEKAGLVHYDGKVEMVFNNGLVLCDVVGTFDENRLGLKGEQVSKEFLRQWYKKNQPDFAPACDKWKETGKGWQERCPVKPVNLPPELSTLVSQMYMAGCNRYTGRRIFDAPELEEVMERKTS